jgi:YD repeat-containing protein
VTRFGKVVHVEKLVVPLADGIFGLRIQVAIQRQEVDPARSPRNRFGQGPRLNYDDSNGVLLSIEDNNGSSLTFNYDSDTLRLISVDDGLGASDDPPAATYNYDMHDRLTSVVRRSGATASYTYDGDSARLVTVIDPNGNSVMTNTYAADGRVLLSATRRRGR